jgi:hypothetical protein
LEVLDTLLELLNLLKEVKTLGSGLIKPFFQFILSLITGVKSLLKLSRLSISLQAQLLVLGSLALHIAQSSHLRVEPLNRSFHLELLLSMEHLGLLVLLGFSLKRLA